MARFMEFTIGGQKYRDNIARVAKEAPRFLQNAYERTLHIIGAELITNMKRSSPHYTGKLRNSHARIINREKLKLIIFNRAKHAIYMHEGTKHNRMPPPAALEKWAARKLGKKGLGFIIARSIQRKGGLKARKWMEKEFNAYQGKAEKRMLDTLDKVMLRIEAL